MTCKVDCSTARQRDGGRSVGAGGTLRNSGHVGSGGLRVVVGGEGGGGGGGGGAGGLGTGVDVGALAVGVERGLLWR